MDQYYHPGELYDGQPPHSDFHFPDTTIEHARVRAHGVIQNLSVSPGTSCNEFITDQAILQALADLHEASNTLVPNGPCFINLSWTIKNRQMHLPPQEQNEIMLVVAAGNDGIDFYAASTPFGSLIGERSDIIAVMNMNRDGILDVNSASIRSAELEGLSGVAVGFDGSVLPDNSTGTSFASPRVAWLLAALEASRPDRATKHGWHASVISQIRRSLSLTCADTDRLFFNPVRYYRLTKQ
jgi:hypothetical protein